MPSAAHEVTEELGEDELAARLAQLTQTGVDDDDPEEFEPELHPAQRGPHPGPIDDTYLERIYKHYGIDAAEANSPAALVYDEDDDEPVGPSGFRWFDPLPNAADEYIVFAQTPERRVYTGIEPFDLVMRGIAPRELLLIVGFAHSGKTVLIAEFLLNNRRKRIAFFTPDETRVLVLIKLVSLVHGISAEDLEERIRVNDQDAIEMVRSTARDEFPRLAVFDQTMGIPQMHAALDEAEASWGGKADAVIFDYADLLEGFDEPKGAINALKKFGKRRNAPMIVLHQSSRSSGKDGQQVTISSGGFGGEQQATFLIGVRRKKSELIAEAIELRKKLRYPGPRTDISQIEDLLSEVEAGLRQHSNTVTFNLVKNKRPPSRLVEELDFILDDQTGNIRQLDSGELTHNLENRHEWEQQKF